jgi:polysaccharide biosynthesis/export protein
VRGGDIVSVGPVLDLLTDHVTLAGHVQRPGAYQWRPGMRLSDLIGSVNQLKSRCRPPLRADPPPARPEWPGRGVLADLAAALASNPAGRRSRSSGTSTR